ncbi:MAG: site-specific integrase [Sedimentisphaerales bacterium]|nr:site-specific integrase [Sedimentisphaerales bacterium]
MLGEMGLAENTVRRTIGKARQFFKAAVRSHLIPANPFDDIPAALRENKSRHYFISRQEADQVLEACPDAQWRLIFVLCRYGGLRCPSEVLSLQWQDIDWERSRIKVTSPKTAHHVGHEFRIIPLFPEIRPYLMDVYEQAEPGTQWIITRYRLKNLNLRTQFQRILRRAHIETWPKLFQNLRSTRETELCEIYPVHVVCAWIGNSIPIAMKNYLQVTDDHFEQAIHATQNATHSTQKTMQNPAAPGDMERNDKNSKTPQVKDNSTLKRTIQAHSILDKKDNVGVTGLEPVTLRV